MNEFAPTRLTPGEHRSLHFFMLLTRAVEERLVRLHRQGRVFGGLYGSRGQEAGAVGVGFATRARDWVAPMIRDLGMSLVRGWEPYDILAQFTARGDSPTLGRDGNLHFGSLEMRQPAPISHLGALLPVAAGMALAARLRGEDSVAVTTIGDGGSSTGAFHEAMNWMAVERLPVVVIGQDNKYAFSTPSSRQMGCERLQDRAAAYGIPASTCDGNDVEEVVLRTRQALAHARGGAGPYFLVLDTFRMGGHAAHDEARYVPDELRARWRALDPVDRHRGRCLDLGVLDRADLAEIRADVDSAVDEAVARLDAAPGADPALGRRWVYAEPGDPRPGQGRAVAERGGPGRGGETA